MLPQAAQHKNDAGGHRNRPVGDKRRKRLRRRGKETAPASGRAEIRRQQFPGIVPAPIGLVRLELHRGAHINVVAEPQPLGRRAALPVFQQLVRQPAPQLLLLFAARKQGNGFQIHQARGHFEKFARDIHILFLHCADLFHILVEQLRDGNVADIQLVFGDQIEQKIQRAVKYRKMIR